MGSDAALFHVRDILDITRGSLSPAQGQAPRLIGRGFSVSGVSTDSRACRPGSLFVALKGERTDGHLHLGDAYAHGARVFLVKSGTDRPRIDDALYVEVTDTLPALQELARRYLARMPGVFRIGITGSNGKTTTKELAGSVLSRAAKTAMNRGNLNSEIGLPLAAFEVRPDDRYAVFEMAMDHEGEMDILSDIVRPDAALITNIGSAHVGRLGSVRAIAEEKKKIFSRFTGKETALIPEADSWSGFLSEDVNGRIVMYGERSTPRFEGTEDMGLEGSMIRWNGLRVRLPLPGRHNVSNALGVITLAVELGIEPEIIREGIESVPKLFGRGEVLEGAFTILQDCYNANPDSMSRALELVKSLEPRGKKILVLGSMKELGDVSEEAHAELGRLAAGSGADGVFFFGSETRSGYEALRSERFEGTAFHTEDILELVTRVRAFAEEGDFILIKGSRAVALERLTSALTGSREKPEDGMGRKRVS